MEVIWILVILFVLIPTFAKRHKWVYRNPANRTCSVCGKHQQAICWADDFERYGMLAPHWWETFHEGDPSKHDFPK